MTTQISNTAEQITDQEQLLQAAPIPVPSFLPEHIREKLSGLQVKVKISSGARLRLRSPENISTADWAVKYRMMPQSEANKGPWRHEYIPHAPQIFEEYDKPYVKEIYYCGPERDGKTNIMTSALGRGQTVAPGNFYFMMPNEKKAEEVSKFKIQEMFNLTKPLRKLLTGKVNDFTVSNARLANGVLGFMAHATSAASLASFSGKYLFGDEIDKNDETVGKETDSVSLLKKRMRDQEDGKLFCASTPAGKFIYKLATQSVRVYEWHMQCPHCHEYFHANDEGLHIPDGATAETIKSGEHVAVQHCQIQGCGAELTEREFNEARKSARKFAIKGADIQRPESVGILRTAWDCTLIPLKEIAESKAKADAGGLAAKRDYAHGYQCINYKGVKVTVAEDRILVLCDDRPEGIIPAGVDIADLLLTVDTQMNHFWYKIRARAYGMAQKSWLIDCGQVQTFSGIEEMMYKKEYLSAQDDNGNTQAHHITGVAIDTGGTKHDGDDYSRTYEVYDWARNHPIVKAFKGAKSGSKPYSVTRLDFFPNGKPIPGGLLLYNVNTNYYKNELFRRLSIQPDKEGVMLLHSGYTSAHLEIRPELRPPNNLKEYAKHMCGEERGESGQWNKVGSRRHDLWDCEYMDIALADILGTRYLKVPGSDPVNKNKPAKKKQPKPGRW